MVLRRLWALALSAQFVSAFKDTSPFFLFSTSRWALISTAQANTSPTDNDYRLSDPLIVHSQLASSSALTAQVSQALLSCPSDTYIIISQPGVSASDFSAGESSPNLRQYLNKTAGVAETWTVAEVAGVLDAKSIEKQVEEKCKADVLRIDATSMFRQAKIIADLY
jgi:hypothetical protein